jgi:hypothetical protein
MLYLIRGLEAGRRLLGIKVVELAKPSIRLLHTELLQARVTCPT